MLKFSIRVTLNRNRLKLKEKRILGKYYEEFLKVQDETYYKKVLQLEYSTLQLCQEGIIEQLEERIHIYMKNS